MQRFEWRLEDNIVALHRDLATGAYHHGPYQRFIVHDPVRREIHKASVRDRLVHHALVRAIEPLFERQFIFDSWACRRGKGTHAAVARFQKVAWRRSRNNTRPVWILKLDIRKCFAAIDHLILKTILSKTIVDPKILRLIAEIVGSFNTVGVSGAGLPLGNLSSQLFANVYLNEFDHFVKGELQLPNYLRYCDDLIYWDRNRAVLVGALPLIRVFLVDQLKLELHPKKFLLRRYHSGVDILGFICFPHFRLLRPATARRVLRRYDSKNAASYNGLLMHCRSFRLAAMIAQ